VKEKREGDIRPAWYATDEILDELSLLGEETVTELKALTIERMRPLVEEADREEQKRE